MVQNHAAKSAAKNRQNQTGESYAQALSKVNESHGIVLAEDDPFSDVLIANVNDVIVNTSSDPFDSGSPDGRHRATPAKEEKEDWIDPYFSYRSDSDEQHEPGQWSPE